MVTKRVRRKKLSIEDFCKKTGIMKVDLAHIFDVSKQRINSFLISTNPNIFVMFNEDEGVVELERDGETILSGKIPMSVSVKASRSKKRKV